MRGKTKFQGILTAKPLPSGVSRKSLSSLLYCTQEKKAEVRVKMHNLANRRQRNASKSFTYYIVTSQFQMIKTSVLSNK